MALVKPQLDDLRAAAVPIDQPAAWDNLIRMAADARLVLIGEASHGTHEFYSIRAELTKRLISEHGFHGVACEADWPDSFRVHRYVTGRSDDPDAETALRDFRRFPGWMWRNTVVVEFLEWLRDWNRYRPLGRRPAGFYGMDLYSMHGSMNAVLRYLQKADPKAALRARERYSCFDHFNEKPEAYALATARGGFEPCEPEVIAQLQELQRKRVELLSRDGLAAEEDFFSAEQNARLVRNAERYYRSMFGSRDESWNLRDTHMFETVERLMQHLDGSRSKLVLWAHNSHLGNAAATEMHERGELNVGQLIRDKYGADAMLIGFSGYTGTVTAASDWGGDAEVKRVRPGMLGSYEELFHETAIPEFWLNLDVYSPAIELLRQPRLLRAIGVIYRPETERWSHYFESHLPQQFDAIIHLDSTRALRPLEPGSLWDESELPETYPFKL